MALIVEIDNVLRKVGERQLTELTPLVEDSYGQYLSSLAGLTMLAVADAYESAAQIRLDENEAIYRLLERAIPHIQDDTLRTNLSSVLEKKTCSIRISDLNDFNTLLRRELICLHAHLEANLDQAWAALLNKDILDEYVVAANRHKFDGLDNFV